MTFHSINLYMDLRINTRGMKMCLVKGPIRTAFINFYGHHVGHCLELGLYLLQSNVHKISHHCQKYIQMGL